MSFDVTLAAAIAAAAAGFWIFWQSRGNLPARNSQGDSKHLFALLIGANRYHKYRQPSFTSADVQLIGRLLMAKGFAIKAKVDCTLHELDRLLTEVKGALKGQHCEVLLFYFAGHAVERNGQNALLCLVLTKRTRREKCYYPGLLSSAHSAASAKHGKVSTSRTVLCAVCLWIWATCPGEPDIRSWDIYQ